jgi:hypothetical protein
MTNVKSAILQLPARHAAALRWFQSVAGTVQSWPNAIETTDGPTLLATKAKGIYKPAWSQYALSVRQTLDGPYPDREPIHRADGTWVYQYFQENSAADARDDEFTNRGLVACWTDGVPVGVMRQVQVKPTVRYMVFGLAIVAGWDGGYFFFEGANRDGFSRERGTAAQFEVLGRDQEARAISEAAFDPGDIIDARERIAALVVRRRGQPQFREALLAAYGGRCAVSACDAIEVLEAAHIVPYAGPATNVLANGLLLRSDVHTLFDLGFLAIDDHTMTVRLSRQLASGAYNDLAGRAITLPSDVTAWPSRDALASHRRWAGL